ncbi:hypothetical protein GCM10022255_091280 [Dactylosporangium darangshiense]|uniref:Transposase IS204/IS1001/IS1096/IS1165 DDE domain-containing protein n=1 Tax=Dactylosporangium darangshiense TaxID=579108 RepID=A0ABP8DPN0_9ACTN
MFLIIDVQTGRPVDVLPDRSAKTFAEWLIAHPGVQVICRDRAGAYAEGARTGAPMAVQVADRWHLWHNLGQAVERTVAACRDALRPEPPFATPPAPTASEARAVPRLADSPLAVRTRQRHHDIHEFLAAGLGVKAIARRLQLAIGTVRRFARAATGTRTAHGSAGPTRTPMACYVSTSPKAPIWLGGIVTTSTLYLRLSTTVHVRHSAGRHQPKH